MLAIFQQGQNCPTTLAEQVVLLHALEQGIVSEMSPEGRDGFRKEIFAYVNEQNSAIVSHIEEHKALNKEVGQALDGVLRQYVEEKATIISEGD